MDTSIRFSISLMVALSAGMVVLAGCGDEEPHTHDTEDFADFAECEAHYQDEGHDDDEIAELCEGLT